MAGQRTHSRITITVDVAHDGNPQLVGEHLALELAGTIGGCRTST